MVRADPASVGSLLSYLERRRLEGDLEHDPAWRPVLNALRLIAQNLRTDIGAQKPNHDEGDTDR